MGCEETGDTGTATAVATAVGWCPEVDGGSPGAELAGEAVDRGQLRSKSSANLSSLLTGIFELGSLVEGGAISSSLDLDRDASRGGDDVDANCDAGGMSADWILYCLPSPNSMTPSRKLSSSSSICKYGEFTVRKKKHDKGPVAIIRNDRPRPSGGHLDPDALHEMYRLPPSVPACWPLLSLRLLSCRPPWLCARMLRLLDIRQIL
jgi:hypothetical protein